MIKPDVTRTSEKKNKLPLLCFRVPREISFSFFKGFKGEEALPLPEPTLKNDYLLYSFPHLPEGPYSYETEGTGFYKIHRNFSYTAQKKALDTEITVKSFPMAGTGYESDSRIFFVTEESEDRIFPSERESFPGLESVFTTPVFLRAPREKGAFQATTREEEVRFIRKILQDVSCVRGLHSGCQRGLRDPPGGLFFLRKSDKY